MKLKTVLKATVIVMVASAFSLMLAGALQAAEPALDNIGLHDGFAGQANC